ncbi:hypothetical protein ColTof3_07457 [Colletotrichum tofieldiae]|nr:hypothetical protein ColTof3_07457 [Colletotrichum tofieldiae]
MLAGGLACPYHASGTPNASPGLSALILALQSCKSAGGAQSFQVFQAFRWFCSAAPVAAVPDTRQRYRTALAKEKLPRHKGCDD